MVETAQPSETASERIAAFVTGFDPAAAPEAARSAARLALIDTIGVMLAGSREPAARIVADMVAGEGAAPAALLVGRPLRASLQGAALANGTANQALDFDFSFMIGQSAAALFPALLPLAEARAAGGADLIAAFIVGAEVCSRLARSYPTLSSAGGWHGAGVLGAVAAAAALARLAGTRAAQIPSVLGIAASAASGVSANFGTMTKPLHAGLAARGAMTALLLGEKGFTASAQAIEGADGLLACFAQDHPWDTAPFDDLGTVFDVTGPGLKFKAFPCGGLMHCAIVAALNLRDAVAPRAARTARITVGVSPHARDRALDRYPWSEDSARFSLPYLVPLALVRGAPTLAAFSDDAYDDDALRALGEKVVITVDETFAHLTGSGYSPARLVIAFDDGSSLEDVVHYPPGTRESPMSSADIHDKFLDCAGRAIKPARARALHDLLDGIDGLENLEPLWSTLAAGGDD